MRPVQTGSSLKSSFDVTEADTAAAIGNVGVNVVSTMTLVKLVEVACFNVIQPHYEPDDATVGTRVALDHVGPAYPGRPVDILATLEVVDGRRMTFTVDVRQDDRDVMSGQHVRVVVSQSKFSTAPVMAGDGPVPEVEFWFDVHSPWCYFASFRIGNLLRAHGGTVKWRPFHLPKLIELIDGRRPMEANDNFVTWFRRDMLDYAELYGLPFERHKNFPLRPARALRSILFAEQQGQVEPYVQRLMRAYWSEQKDISDPEVLAALGAEVGVDAEGVLQASEKSEYYEIIAAHVEEAASRGIFGAPAMLFDDRLYWGNDRLDMLDRHLGRWRARKISA